MTVRSRIMRCATLSRRFSLWLRSPLFAMIYMVVLCAEYTLRGKDEQVEETGVHLTIAGLHAMMSLAAVFPILLIAGLSIASLKIVAFCMRTSATRQKQIHITLSYILGFAMFVSGMTIIFPYVMIETYVWEPLFKQLVPKLYENFNHAVYTPLDRKRKQIRTIILHPPEGDQTVRCTLHTQDVDGPSFEALSYTWGGHQALRRIIYVNDRPFLVTNNVQHALLALRHPITVRRLWIDQICINQADVLERNHQVQYCMREVYSHATQVIAWLGPGQQNRVLLWMSTIWSIAMQVLESSRRFRGLSPSMNFESLEDFFTFDRPVDSTKLSTNQSSYIDPVIVKDMLRKRWWCRVWVIQEVALAPQLILKMGSVELDWNMFCSHLSDQHQIGPEQRALLAIRTGENGGVPADTPLLSLMVHFSQHQASNTKDHLFGLYALVQEGESLVPVDYRRNADDIFADFTANVMRSNQSLQILSLSRRTLSWRPGCTWLVPGDNLDEVLDENQFWGIRKHEWSDLTFPLYNACGKLKARVHQHPSVSQWLLMQGIVVSEAKLLGIPYSDADEDFDGYLSAWLEIAGFGDADILDERNPQLLEFFNTLTVGANSDTSTKTEVAKIMCRDRRFFITEEGFYGLGPADMKSEDKIYLVPGADVPLVLRHKTHHIWERAYHWFTETENLQPAYNFVGFCYVSGLMDNPDLADKMISGETILENFWLM